MPTLNLTHPSRPAAVPVRLTFSAAQLTVHTTPTGFVLKTLGAGTLRLALQGHWYGQGELAHQLWPLNKAMLPAAPLRTADNGPTGLLCIQTPAWLCSAGFALLAHSPVTVGLNQPPATYPVHTWDLSANQAPFAERPFADPGGVGDGHLTLTGKDLQIEVVFPTNVPISNLQSLVSLYHTLLAKLGTPTRTPPAELFTLPTWATWARYKTDIHQDLVHRFAQDIVAHQFPYGVLEIDDRWQKHYGDLDFDPARFPDPKGLIDQLHALGFKVTAWVIPFLDPASQAFAEGAAQGFLVRDTTGAPYAVRWWQGVGGLLDVTNPAALAWFLARLRALQAATGLDGFKFDAGEAIFLPPDAVLHQPGDPNAYSRLYVDFVAEHFALTEVRTGWRNQRAPIFFRQWDKTTTWGLDNGLHSVLTSALTLALTGYPFILPDMVGGNAYAEQADAELMIRWTQLNALLPAIQFSLLPWEYGAACEALCRRYAQLHVDFAPEILRLAEATTRTGAPIVRPVFWLAPEDERALLCDDEFLLGEDWLVAPVVQPGARTRNIYLPPGHWRDHWTHAVFTGPTVLTDYPAGLEVLPLFERRSEQ